MAMISTQSHSQEISEDFSKWSNSISRDEAIQTLIIYLNKIESVDLIVRKLSEWGFNVAAPVPIDKHTAKILGLSGNDLVSIVADWNTREDGAIFSPSLMDKIDSSLFTYGTTLELIVSDSANVEKLNITKTRE